LTNTRHRRGTGLTPSARAGGRGTAPRAAAAARAKEEEKARAARKEDLDLDIIPEEGALADPDPRAQGAQGQTEMATGVAKAATALIAQSKEGRKRRRALAGSGRRASAPRARIAPSLTVTPRGVIRLAGESPEIEKTKKRL
jgi:hypothetical protein